MKKKMIFWGLAPLLMLLFSCATTQSADGNDQTVASKSVIEKTVEEDMVSSPFEGEYYITYSNSDGVEAVYESFIVDGEGNLSGVVESSGLTSFRGTIAEDGSFTADFIRLGGTMVGTIDTEGNVEGSSTIRGRDSLFNGEKY